MRSIMRLWVFLVVLVSLVAAPTTVLSADAVDAASMPAASAAAASPGFVPLSPSRLLDTRSTGVPVRPGTAVPVVVVGRSGVPASGVGAVVVNLTAVSPGAAGYVTAYASGAAVPVVSNLNYATGQTVANQAVVQVGSGGRINVKTSAAAHLLVDVVGYFRSGETFVPVAPRRVLDTRSSTPVTGGTARTVSIGGLPSTGVAGVVVNVTAVSPRSAGYLTVHPGGQARPTASAVNFPAGRNVAGLVIVKGRDVSVYTSATSNVLVDVLGWIREGGDYVALSPARVKDTRASTRVAARRQLDVRVTDIAGVPGDRVAAVEVNVTAVNPSASGYLTVLPTGSGVPSTSTVNFGKGVTTANSATAKVGYRGQITIYASTDTDVIVDVVGYFTRPSTTLKADELKYFTLPSSELYGLSCPEEGFCVGTDYDGTARTFDHGVWSAPVPVVLDQRLTVTCASRTFCLATGRQDDGTVVASAFDGSRWTRTTMPAVSAIDCLAADFCRAVAGNSVLGFDGISWRTVHSFADYAGEPYTLTSVDCLTRTFCAVTGSGHGLSTWNGSTWTDLRFTTPFAVGSGAVSCVSTTDCRVMTEAGDLALYDGSTYVLTEDQRQWGASARGFRCFADGSCVVGVSRSAVSTYRAGSWTSDALPGVPPNSAVLLDCAPTGWCMAVVGTRWVVRTPAGFAGSGAYQVSAVDSVASCPSSEGCIVSVNSSTWLLRAGQAPRPVADEPAGMSRFSCVALDFCVSASDFRSYLFDGTSWTELPTPGTVAVNLITCTSRTFCMALGPNNSQTFDGTSWTVRPGALTQPHGLDCSSPTFCVATGAGGKAYTWNGATWSSPKVVDGNYAHSVGPPSCPTDGFCVAGGSGWGYVLRAGTWTSTLLVNGLGATSPVRCASSASCRATGGFALVNGVWGADPTPQLPISCITSDYCLATSNGYYREWF